MIGAIENKIPLSYLRLAQKSKEIGFTMPSDMHIGSLLRTLIASKQCAKVLELGTGIGLSLAWILDGIDDCSEVISIDNDPDLIRIVEEEFKEEKRLSLICGDGSDWFKEYAGSSFDLIFADTWPGKYTDLNLALDLVKKGGFYIVDDMTQQANWPLGHDEKAALLIKSLEDRTDFKLTKIAWSTGIIIATKII